MRVLLTTVAIIAALATGLGEANATYHVAWNATVKGDTNIKVYYNGDEHRTQAGAYRLRISDDANLSTYVTVNDAFCLDLQHVANTAWWDASLHVLPPDYIPDPPPSNVWEAGWLVQNHDWSSSNDYAAGMQLALWELSHEAGFGVGSYDVTTWYSSGSFTLNTSTASLGARDRATDLLGYVLAAGENPPLDSYVEYYEPDHSVGDYGQGMLREGSPIPEPGTMLLLGTALITGAGLAWRRRFK